MLLKRAEASYFAFLEVPDEHCTAGIPGKAYPTRVGQYKLARGVPISVGLGAARKHSGQAKCVQRCAARDAHGHERGVPLVFGVACVGLGAGAAGFKSSGDFRAMQGWHTCF